MKNHSSLVVWALAAAVLGGSVACGEVSSKKADASMGDTAPAGDFTIGVNPGTLSIGITGEGSVAIDLVRGEGLTDAVALSVTGAPTGVTTELDVASLPLGSNTANLTVTAGNTAEAGTATLTVTATAGTVTHTATLDLTLTTLTVAGTIRTGTMGVVVRIVGKPAATSDANGAFMFTDVKVPYDIYVIGTETGNVPAVNYYKGLTRPDPVLTRPRIPVNIGIIGSGATNVDGTLSGADATAATMVMWSTNGAVTNLAAGVNAYNNVAATWSGLATSNTGKLHAIQITRGVNNRPTAYPRYGVSASTQVDEAVDEVLNLTLAAPTTAGLTGNITQPPGYVVPTVTLSQQFTSRIETLWTAQVTDGSCRIPVLVEGKSSYHGKSTLNVTGGQATSEFVYPGLNADTDITYTMTPAPTMTGPVNNATNVTGTTPFEFTTAPQTVYKVSMTSASANFHVFTTTGSVTLPTVSELPLPSNTSFSWTVAGFGPAATINASADTNALSTVSVFESTGALHYYLTIPSRAFTTQ